MKNCEIQIKRGVPIANTYPGLMRDILKFTNFDIEQSMDLYGVTLLPEFQELQISKPGLNNILSFIEQDQINQESSFNKKDLQNILDLSLQEESGQDFKQKFLDSFTVNGSFGIEQSQIIKGGLLKDSDILGLENNIEDIKNLYYKILNSTENFETISSNFILKNNLFSKENPDAFVQNLYDNYIGLNSEKEIFDKAQEIGDQVILDNPILLPKILEEIRGKENLVQYEVDETTGQIILKTMNNIQSELEQTIDMNQDYSDFLQRIEYSLEFPKLHSELIQDIEKEALKLGINIQGITDSITSKDEFATRDFLSYLYNFIYDIQTKNPGITESLSEYSDAYNEFFDTIPQGVNRVVPTIKNEGVYLHLETNQSEEELFQNEGLLRISDNIYQKITDDKTLEDLYDLIFQNSSILPKNIYSVEVKNSNKDLILDDIDSYVTNEARNYLRENSDIEQIKKMVVYKILTLNEYKPSEKTFSGNLNIDVDKFFVDFQKQILKNPDIKQMFYFSNRGVEFKYPMSEYSARKIKNSIPQATFENLVKYAKLSGNQSLEYLTSYDNDILNENPRDFYANNLDQLPVFNGNFYKDSGYVVADSQNDFLRIQNELYEQVSPNIYAKIERNHRYINFGLTKPDYTGSIEPNLKSRESGRISVKKTKEINTNNIEFC